MSDAPPAPSLRTARLLLGPAQLAVVALVTVLALGVTCWWLARGRPDSTVALQSAPASALTQAAADSAGPSTGASNEAAATNAQQVNEATAQTTSATATQASGSAAGVTTVTVDVAGKVRRSGIQVLPVGSRIADALAAAGGAKPGVDVTELNLAQVLVDGEQVLVGVAGGGAGSTVSEPSSAVGSGAADAGAAAAGAVQVVDLNTATADQLDSLPDVGPVTAQSILSWRSAHGGFTSVDELLEVDGIGEVTLGKLAPFVTV